MLEHFCTRQKPRRMCFCVSPLAVIPGRPQAEPGIQTLMQKGWIPGSRWRAPRNDGYGAASIACISRSSAAAVKTSMLAKRSALPVSSVIARSTGPATAMQLWPEASP